MLILLGLFDALMFPCYYIDKLSDGTLIARQHNIIYSVQYRMAERMGQR